MNLTQPLDWREYPRDAGFTTDLCELALRLPELNTELIAGRRCPVRTVLEIMDVIAKAVSADFIPDSDRDVLYTWQGFCFSTAFAERWRWTARMSSRSVYDLLPPTITGWLEKIMRRTGAGTPRLGLREYWLDVAPNSHGPTFTGSRSELFFREQVHEVSDKTRTMGQELWNIVRAGTPLSQVRDQLQYCARLAASLNQGMLALTKAFSPGEFQTSFRQGLGPGECPVVVESHGGVEPYLGAITVGRRTYAGPNAAHVPGVPILDLALGIGDAAYRMQISERFEFYSLSDRRLVQPCLAANRSLVDVLAENLELSSARLVSMSAAELGHTLKSAPPSVFAATTALSALGETWRKWSGAHFAAIDRHVLRAHEHVPEAVLATLPVSHVTGVSGNSVMEHAAHVANLRKHGFLTSKLPVAVRIATPGANDASYVTAGA